MNIIRIAIKELKVFREPKMLVFMLATPVLIMLILGTALINAFNGNVSISDIRILIQIESSNQLLTTNWNELVQEAEQSGIVFEQNNDRAAAVREVQKGKYTGYALISDAGIDYFGNSSSPIENSIVQGMLSAFVDRYKLAAMTAAKQSEHRYTSIDQSENGKNLVNMNVNHANKQPGSLDYYAVAITTMIILYSALTSGQLMENERKRSTAIRLLASPVSKVEIFTGKIVGAFLLNVLFIVIIVFISKYMFGAYWGERLDLVLIVLFTQIIFALGLGLGFSYVIKGNASGTVIMVIIQLEAFFGGAYFPVDDASGFIGLVSKFSPLRETNHAILQLIYADNFSPAIPAMLFNVGCATLLLVSALFMVRRREGL